MPVGRSRNRPQRDTRRVDGNGALESLFAPVHRAAARHLAAARGFGDAAIDGHVVQDEPDHPVVGGQHHGVQGRHHPGGDPLVPPPPQGGHRAGRVGDARVRATEDQHLHQRGEDDPIRDAPAMAAERMGHLAGGEQGGELVPDGLDDG